MAGGSWRLALAVSTLAALAACAPYRPAPLDLAAYPNALDARRLPQTATTEAELLAVALANNPTIAEARSRHAAALAAVKVARVSPGPSLSLTAEYASETPRWGYGAAADFPLEVGGVRSNRVTTAQLTALQAFYDYGEAVWTVRTAVRKAWLDLAAALEQAPLAEQAAAVRRERLQRLERRVAAGEDPRSSSLIATAELATAERRVAEIHDRADQARVALARAAGLPASALATLAPTPTNVPPPLDRASPWRREALLSRADVLRAVAGYDLAENALRAEVTRQYPSVRLGPGYNYDHGVDKLPFTVSLGLPPLDLNRAAIAQAEAARVAAGRAVETAQAEVIGAVDAASGRLEAARMVTARLRAADLPAAQALADRTERAVRAGEVDRADELAVRATELELRLAVLEAEAAARGVGVDLEDALRRPFDPAEAAVLQSVIQPERRS